MSSPQSSICPKCSAPLVGTARFCIACGHPIDPPQPAGSIGDEITLSRRLRVTGDAVNMRSLQQLVQDSVTWWQQRLNNGEVSRDEAVRNIEELRRALLSLSHQLFQGREKLRITTTLPKARRFPIGCPRCGHGNRHGAHFCYACGWSFATPSASVRPSRFHYATALLSDTGRVRQINQDSGVVEHLPLGAQGEALLCIVADGMGGASGGEEASRMACETIVALLQQHLHAPPQDPEGWRALLREAVEAANKAIHDRAKREPALHGMGTTVVMALIIERQAYLASVGDSRIYLINRRGIADDGLTWAQLTVDHTLVSRLVDLGLLTNEQAGEHPRRNVLYRSVGVEAKVEVDTEVQPLQPGDHLLLCSDGLTGFLEGREMAEIALQQPSPQAAVERMVALANERGGRDNITALLVSIDSPLA